MNRTKHVAPFWYPPASMSGRSRKLLGRIAVVAPDDKKSPSLFTPARSVIVDPVGYEEYKKLAGATVKKYGGKYIVRGGKTEVLEGDWKPKRIVVLEFESAERAREWLNCEEYREPRKMRHRTARTNMILVEGNVPSKCRSRDR